MKNVIFDFSTMHQYGPAFFDFLRLRKQVFVDDLEWDVPHNMSAEMDQYDNPTAFYSLVIEHGRVIAGARVMPTTATWGENSYMLRDAALGKLPDIPNNLPVGDLVDPEIWEVTRLAVSNEIASKEKRAFCVSAMMDGMIQIAATRGGRKLISLSPVLMRRTLRTLGYFAEQVGDAYFSPEDGRKYAVLSLSVEQPVYESVAA